MAERPVKGNLVRKLKKTARLLGLGALFALTTTIFAGIFGGVFGGNLPTATNAGTDTARVVATQKMHGSCLVTFAVDGYEVAFEEEPATCDELQPGDTVNY